MRFFKLNTLNVAVLSLISVSAYAQDIVKPVQQLETIVVTADKEGAKSRTNVVTTEIANKRTETDLRGLLNEEPAIDFGGGNGTSQWVTIRGMGQDQIDVKVDNAYSDTQIFHHQGRFMLDPSLVKIVSVQKGAGSASAGIGATSGAIVARTLDAKDLLQDGKNYGAKVSAGYSSNDGHNKGISVFGKAGAFDALVAGNWTTEEVYKAGKVNNENAEVKNSALDQRALLAKIGVNWGNNNRVVLSHRQELNTGTRALREEFDFSQVGNDARNAPRYREISIDNTNLEWNGENVGIISRGDANVYVMNNTRKDFETSTPSKVEITTKGANLNLDSQVGEKTILKYGVNYRHQQGKPSALTNGAKYQEKTDTGVYVEAIGQVGVATVTAGMRYDRFDFNAADGKKVSNDNLNPSIGFIVDATDHLSFHSNLSYATRSPRIYEVAIAGGSNRSGLSIMSIADGIKPERARNVEVGFNYDNGSFSAEGSYFWQRVEDAHGYRSTTTTGVREIANLGLVKNTGYELATAYKWHGLTARAGVAYSEPETYGSLGDSTLFAVQTGRTWTTGLSYRFANPSVELGWRGRFVESATGNPSRGSSAATTPVKRLGYGVNDFYANWKPLNNDRLNVNLAVNNAFDKFYRPHAQRAGESTLPGVGRDIRVGVNYTF